MNTSLGLSGHDEEGRRLAVMAEALYLANLLVLPGLALAALLTLWLRQQGAL